MCLGTTSLGRLKFLSFGKRRVLEFEEIETQRRIGRGEGTPIRMRPRIGTPTIFKKYAFPPLKVLYLLFLCALRASVFQTLPNHS